MGSRRGGRARSRARVFFWLSGLCWTREWERRSLGAYTLDLQRGCWTAASSRVASRTPLCSPGSQFRPTTLAWRPGPQRCGLIRQSETEGRRGRCGACGSGDSASSLRVSFSPLSSILSPLPGAPTCTTLISRQRGKVCDFLSLAPPSSIPRDDHIPHAPCSGIDRLTAAR
ncbi:hypothetical protein B0H10DRAFT_691085 [Mycena sp. CBHHK59/15]|nr:hypothetical protein B0H10DRAFT_691085 [Mycena sp. CBHHK59/15]